jgi:hypothetical protein
MTLVVGAVIAWLVLFAALLWAMKHDAEDAPVHAKPIDPVEIDNEMMRESVEQQQDRRIG